MTECVVEIDNEEDRLKTLDFLQKQVEPANTNGYIDSVCVASDFQNSARRFLPEGERDSYNPIHDYGIAVAKTIPYQKNSELRFAIIFDSRVFNPRNMNEIDMTMKISHELTHVKNGVLRFQAVGPDRYFGNPKGKKEFLLENAWRLWEEYDSERFIAETVVAAVNSLSSDAKVEFNHNLSLSDDAIAKLKEFEPFVEESVRRFRYWEIDVNEITLTITTRIASIAILLAYVYALEQSSEGIKQKIKTIESESSFVRFFGDHWTVIKDNLSKYFRNRDVYDETLLEAIGVAYEGIIRDSSLEFRDHGEGYYVEVRDLKKKQGTTS
jgi:hypothetical protein